MVCAFEEFHHNLPRSNCIRLSVVVIKFGADVGGESTELVVGEVGPSLAGEF